MIRQNGSGSGRGCGQGRSQRHHVITSAVRSGSGSAGQPSVAQIQLSADRAQIEAGAKPRSDPGHHDRIRIGIPGWLSARRAPFVPGRDLGCLRAELAQQHAGAGGDPEGEVLRRVLAEFKLGYPREQALGHCPGREAPSLAVPPDGGRSCSHQ